MACEACRTLILLSFCRVMMQLWITNGMGRLVPLFHYKNTHPWQDTAINS
jgi:hypothetical protein